MSTAIVTDTNSGIFSEEGEKNGIGIVPMPIVVDGVSYLEGIDIDQKMLMDALYGGRNVSSSQPSPSSVTGAWEEALKEHDEVVYIPMTSGLSSSYDTARMLAGAYEGKVIVVDNRRISVTLRTAVYQAKKMAEKGKNAEEISRILVADTYNACIFISADTLVFLKKGGRISPAVASIGTVLNIKPVMTINGGKLEAYSKVRGMKKAKQSMVEALGKDLQSRFPKAGKDDIIVAAAGTFLEKSEEEEWCGMVKDNFPGYDFLYNPLPLSIASHVGANAAGIGYVLKEPLQFPA